MVGIKDRVRKLGGMGEPCPECGWSWYGPKQYEVIANFEGEPSPEPEVCPTCGHADIIKVTWGDEDGA